MVMAENGEGSRIRSMVSWGSGGVSAICNWYSLCEAGQWSESTLGYIKADSCVCLGSGGQGSRLMSCQIGCIRHSKGMLRSNKKESLSVWRSARQIPGTGFRQELKVVVRGGHLNQNKLIPHPVLLLRLRRVHSQWSIRCMLKRGRP